MDEIVPLVEAAGVPVWWDEYALLDAERLSDDGRGEVPTCYTEGLKALLRARYVEEEYPESQSYRVTRAGFTYAATGREPEQLIQTVSEEGRKILRQAVTSSKNSYGL